MVTEDDADGLVAGKEFREAQRLGDPAFALLIGVIDVFQPEVAAIPQEP